MGLADYTAIVEAGNAVVDLLRDNLPLSRWATAN